MGRTVCKLPKVQPSLNKHYRQFQQLNTIVIGAEDVNDYWPFYTTVNNCSKVLVFSDNTDSMIWVHIL